MIHILNFKGEIIDFISKDDNHIIYANHKRNINERSETFDFTILSKRAEHLHERNRIIIQDSNKQYREFIIEHISSDIDGYTTVESSASYLQDISTAKPCAPSTLENITTKQALSEVLADTGWKPSDMTEYGGTKTTSWTSYQTRYEVLLQLCTTYDMMLGFYIELGSNTVKNRYVTLKKRNPLFKGKEIVYGKDLTGLKRTVDLSNIKTALLCISPEDDKGQRKVIEVRDNEAQQRFGLPQRYIWDVYEPESNDNNMTEERLRTLGTTELNKRKAELISYEVSSLDLKDNHPHEVIHLGDKVRIKNRDFTPPLYVEAEVVGEDYDLISKESNYIFGQYKEYREEDLRKAFEKRLNDIRDKLNDSISNVNTIVQETLDTELQYFEKKIIKSNTAPSNPVNDVLWLDTSNPNVPILKRYWNGEWIKSSVDNVEQIGGVTKEKALFSELSNTFINLTIQHSKLLNEMYEVINNEYLVDESLKLSLNTNLDKTITTFSNIKTNLESMTPDTATIGKLVDTQALFLKYREELQALYKVVEQAKISINARFKLLQSQYTDEKFNKALTEVADKFGLQVSEDNQLIGEPNVVQKAISIVTEQTDNKLASYVKSEDYQTDKKGIVERLNNSDSERQQLSNQIADRVTLTEYSSGIKDAKDYADSAMNNLEIGGRNLIPNSNDYKTWRAYSGASFVFKENQTVTEWGTSNATSLVTSGVDYGTHRLKLYHDYLGGVTGEIYTVSIYIKNNNGNARTLEIRGLDLLTGGIPTLTIEPNSSKRYIVTGKRNSSYSTIQTRILSDNISSYTNMTMYGFKIEKGSKATDYTVAPEDTEQKLTTMKTEILQDGKQIAQTVSSETFDSKAKTLNRVVSQYINDTTTGHQFTYDANGNISSLTVGDGVKIKGDKIDIEGNTVFKNTKNDLNGVKDGTTKINANALSNHGMTVIDGGNIQADNMTLNNLTINRQDGVPFMQNGMIRNEYLVTTTFPAFMSSTAPSLGDPYGGVLHFYQAETYYQTTRSVLSTGAPVGEFGRLSFYRFYHSARYVIMRVVINCKDTGGVVMMGEPGKEIYEIASVAQNDSRADKYKEVSIDLVEDLGKPTYERKSFYLYFKPNGQGTSTSPAKIRVMECRITDYL